MGIFSCKSPVYAAIAGSLKNHRCSTPPHSAFAIAQRLMPRWCAITHRTQTGPPPVREDVKSTASHSP